MKIFELNSESLRKGWGGADQYWFSLNDYKIRDVSTLAQIDRPEHISQSAYFVSIGYIPYFIVTNEEVIRSYVETFENEKLKSVFSKLDSNNYVESFWKYFNVYPQISEGLDEFEDKYVLNKAINWCKENAINYTIA
jgi:hypothetical protein